MVGRRFGAGPLRPQAAAVEADTDRRTEIPGVGPKRRSVGPPGGLAGHQRAIEGHDHALGEGLPRGAGEERDPEEDAGADRPGQLGEALAPPSEPVALVGEPATGLLC